MTKRSASDRHGSNGTSDDARRLLADGGERSQGPRTSNEERSESFGSEANEVSRAASEQRSDGGERSRSDRDPRRMVSDGGSEDGLVTVESDADVETSVERVRDAIEANENLGLMAEFDHEENAESVGLDLPPTTVLVFGNPDLGTPLMRDGRTLAIDLPQKLLVTERDDGTVTVAYNDPAYLADRHGIEGEDDRLDTVSDALSSLAAVAAGKE